jgi:hypothetical protein
MVAVVNEFAARRDALFDLSLSQKSIGRDLDGFEPCNLLMMGIEGLCKEGERDCQH